MATLSVYDCVINDYKIIVIIPDWDGTHAKILGNGDDFIISNTDRRLHGTKLSEHLASLPTIKHRVEM